MEISQILNMLSVQILAISKEQFMFVPHFKKRSVLRKFVLLKLIEFFE